MMDLSENSEKSRASARLAALAADPKSRSKAARLRDLVDDVEAAMRAGVSRAVIVRELESLGLVVTLQTFALTLTLKRIRKARRGSRERTGNGGYFIDGDFASECGSPPYARYATAPGPGCARHRAATVDFRRARELARGLADSTAHTGPGAVIDARGKEGPSRGP